MNCSFIKKRISASRALVARLVAVLIALQAFIPGVLAYSGDDEGIWCFSFADQEQADRSTPPAHEPCIVCTVMSAGNAPVAAVPPVIQLAQNVEPVHLQSSRTPSSLPFSAGVSPPIRAPPSVAAAARPDCDAQGRALA